MKHFALEKTDISYLLKNKLSLNKGYKFNKRVTITLYNNTLTKTILEMKIQASLNKILKAYSVLEDDDEDGINSLLIKSETLRNILTHKYYPYIGKNKAKYYLLKLGNIESTLSQKKIKKPRVR